MALEDEDRLSDGSIRLVVRRRSSDGVPRSAPAEVRAEALLSELDRTTDRAVRARLLVELAVTLRDGLGDPSQAVDALIEAWRSDPTNDAIVDNLEPLVRSQNRWLELLEQTRALAGSEQDHARSLAYGEAMVRWLTRDVPNVELARQWTLRVRAIDPTHPLVHLLQAQVSREHGDYKRELDELDFAVLSTRRKDERVRLHLLLASRYLEERTLDRAQAKKQFEEAHRLLPDMMDPLRGLEALAAEDGDTLALADVLRRQADADVDEQERVRIRLRLASIEEHEFRRPELAARTLERVLARAQQSTSSAVATLGVHYDAVLDGLERCYRAARMWPELLAILELAAIGDSDTGTRASRLKQLGDVLESKMGDVRAALETYRRLAGLLPDDETVVSELARLAEKVSDVTLAVNCRERLAELAADPIVRARHNYVAGQLTTPIDPAAARRYFERAVAMDPSSAPAWNALLWGAKADGDEALVARYLEMRASAMESPRARAACLVELAELRGKMGDAHAARQAYFAALSADATNENAASALLEHLIEQERYVEAEPLCAVVSAAAERDGDRARLYLVRRAEVRVALALGKPDVALASALAAYEIRRGDVEAQKMLVRVAHDMRADPQVLHAQDALVAIADVAHELVATSRVALAEVLALIGENGRAAVLFDGVLAERSDDERSLAGLSQLHAASGNKLASLVLKRQMAELLADPAERLAALLETAEAFAEIGADELAADVYESARALAPSDLGLLHKLLSAQQRARRWAKVFDVLGWIADVDTDPHRRAKALFTMGKVANTELLDRRAALEAFDKTLDVDPSQLDAFERIARILTDAKDWMGLEQMYKRMIARADARGDERLAAVLNKQLGLVYRDRLRVPELAIGVLRRAVELRPKDEEAQAMLRELFESSGHVRDAVDVTLERVVGDPMDPRPYPALFELLVAEGARDKALCVSSVMKLFNVAHPTAAEWRKSHPPTPIEGIALELEDGGYRELLHPELDPSLTEMFQIVAPALIDLALSRLTLRERMKHPGPALKDQAWLTSAVARAARVLGVPAPALYARRLPGPAFTHAPTKPPSLTIYAPALAGLGSEVVAFMIGRKLLELTPPLLVRALCPSLTELKALASSAARIVQGRAEPGDLPLKQRLSSDDLGRIHASVSKSMAEGGKLDVLRWSELVDLSASYGGLLLAGDLEAARAAIAIEPQAPSDLKPREKLRELVSWFIGEDCARLRRHIGVALR